MVALDEADVATGPRNTDIVMSRPGHCVEQVMGDVRSKSPSRTTHAERAEACEGDDEIAVTGSGLKQ
jgi:hypothetical protein